MGKIEDLRLNLPRLEIRKNSGKRPYLNAIIVMLVCGLVFVLFRERVSGFINLDKGKRVAVKLYRIPSADDDRKAVESFSAAGYVEIIPPGAVMVSSLVSGKVKSIHVKPGDRVEKGGLLATLDSSVYEQELNLELSRKLLAEKHLEKHLAGYLKEEIQKARAKLDAEQAALDLADKTFMRDENLLRRKLLSMEEFEQSRTGLLQARARVQEAKAELELVQKGTRKEVIEIASAELAAASAAVDAVKWKIQQCLIKSPDHGIVLKQYSEVGNWIDPQKESNASAALCSIFNPKSLQVWVDVNQRDSGQLFEGQKVALKAEADPENLVNGTISCIMPEANRQKNTLQVKVSLDDVPDHFRPEMSVSAKFLPRKTEGAGSGTEVKAGFIEVRIPSAALFMQSGEPGVFVKTGSRVSWKRVRVVSLEGDRVLVGKSLDPGTVVVLNPHQAGIIDGQEISTGDTL